MPIAVNPDTGAVLHLGDDGQWSPAKTAVNPQTKEMLAFDGKDWAPVPAKSKGVLGYIDDAVRSIASGLTFGYMDEAAAKLDEWTGRGGAYEQNVAKERARDAQIPAAIGVPGEIGGAVLSTVAAAPAAGAAAAWSGLSRLPTLLRFAGLGLGEGALAGSGKATEGNRIEGALEGGAVGLAVGAAAPYAVRGVAGAYQGVKNAVSPRSQVGADLSRAIVRDADDPAALIQRAQQAAIDRPGATLADVGGENVRGIVERVAQTPGAGRTQIIPALTARQEGQAARITEDLRTLTGTNRTARQAVEETMAERAAAARPLYDEAFDFNARSVPEIVRAFENATSTGYGKAILNGGALKKAIQTEYGIQNVKDAPLMVLIDAWKKQADDQVGAAVRSGAGNTSRVLTRMRDDVVRVVDQFNPKYADARKAWETPSKYLDAIEGGRGILSTKVSAEEFAANFARMSDANKEAHRIGAVSSIVAKMGNDGANLADMTKYLRSPEVRAKIAAIMPTPEAAQAWARRLEFEIGSSKMTGRALGNSATARRLAEQEDAKGLVTDLVIDALAQAPMSMIRRIASAGPRWLRDTARSRSDALMAEILTDPQALQQLPALLQRGGAATRPVSGRTNAIVTGAGAEQGAYFNQ